MGSAISSPSTRRSGHITSPVRLLTRREPSMPGMKMTGGLPEPGAAGGVEICGRFGRSAGRRQPVNETANEITNRMAAAGKTIVSAGRFFLGGAIMSNPVQDAMRELKIIPCFVGTVAHLDLTNIDELYGSDPPWPRRFLALHIDLCYYRRAFYAIRITNSRTEFSQSTNSCYAIKTIKSRTEFSLSSNSCYATGTIMSGTY